ncbi:MAG: FtsK/SpoIIIE domain-containing protein [Ornithinibacter sp.]
MEMTLTVHVPRRRPHPVDVVVDWSGRSTVAELCAALSDHLGEPVPGLSSGGRALPPDAEVGMPPLLHGASVSVDTSPAGGSRATTVVPEPRSMLDLVVVGGPDAGRRHPLSPPGLAVGRAPVAGLVVDDESLSRSHLYVAVGSAGVTVEDRASTNGVVVDGAPINTVTPVDATSTVVIGSTTLRLRRAGGPSPPARLPGDGTVQVTSAPGAATALTDVRVARPEAPQERPRGRVPWLAAVAPVPVAIALAFFLGPQLLLFAALGPVSLLAGALGDRWGFGRARRRELATHALALEQARARLAAALRSERERLDRAHPDPAAVLATAERRVGGLWSSGGSTRVRLGLGDVPTRVVWVEGTTEIRPPAAHAPLVVDLAELSCLGVVGSSAFTDGHLANLVGQLCTANAPHELSLSVASCDPQWSWVGRLPHANGPVPQASRSPSTPGQGNPQRRAGGLRVLVVPRSGPSTTGLVKAALADGAVVLVAATTRAGLAAPCSAVVHRGESGHLLDRLSGSVAFVPDLVGPWWVDRLSRALAPVRCADPRVTAGMPTRLTLADALGGELTGVGVADRWRAREVAAHRAPSATSALPAVVGSTPQGAFVIDLCRDGPHVLVGGTTGSGKSEFLRTLVTSLAVAAPPEELTFVLVDFKGGAAFGPCSGLPHVVGLVTDLDDHLVSRALASLRAELRRRERILATVGASDLAGYERLRVPGTEQVPRLVVVVDELRALVEELPEFVTGLVRLAAQGRSLGVHLVLATQRPSGALSAEVQANVSLRIAFRMRDRADSVDVLDDGAAAGIAPSTPGRALARGADGSLVTFQSATVAAAPVHAGTGITVRPVVEAEAAGRSSAPEDAGADTDRPPALVSAVREAHRLRGGGLPRSPWMAPLPVMVTSGDGDRAASGEHCVVVGLVDEPDLQRVTPLQWDAKDGLWLLAGGAGSGRTTALRALALSAARRSGPESLHLHVIDGRGSLADLAALPHLGTRAGVHDVRASASLVQHLRSEVDHRLAAAAAVRPGASAKPLAVHAPPTILLLVDGWEQLVEAHPAHGSDHLTGMLLRVLRDGRSVGVVGAVTGGRSLLHPRWGEVAGRTFLMGRVDPLDVALAGLRSTDAPRDPPPGRAVRVHDKREVQFVQATASESTAIAQRAAPRPAHGAAWRWVSLPTVVRREELSPVTSGREGAEHHRAHEVLLGIGGEHATSFSWRPETDGRRLLVVGPPRSGRTNALRAVAQSICETGRLVAVVTSAGPGRMPWPAGALAINPDDTGSLVRLRRRHRDLALCIDDADRLGDSNCLPVVREIAGLVDRDGGLVVVSTSPVALATRFSGIDVEVARDGCGLVLSPTPADRSLLSATIPDGIPRLPGRGVFVAHGDVTEVQVVLAEPSVGNVATGEHLGLGVPGHPGRPDAHHGHHEHDPADRHPGALDEADADGQQDRIPDDGRGPWP